MCAQDVIRTRSRSRTDKRLNKSVAARLGLPTHAHTGRADTGSSGTSTPAEVPLEHPALARTVDQNNFHTQNTQPHALPQTGVFTYGQSQAQARAEGSTGVDVAGVELAIVQY